MKKAVFIYCVVMICFGNCLWCDDQQLPNRSPKIVALLPARNESLLLPQCLKGLACYADAIVYLDDASDDNSVEIVRSLAQECRVEQIIIKSEWYRDEPGDRNKLLEAGRKIGGTHFIVLDADELFTANCMQEDFLKKLILQLNPGDTLLFNWIQLWRSVDYYRFDASVWTWNYKDFVFCDDSECSFNSEFIHTSRTPSNLKGNRIFLQGYEYGVLHFQFVNWRNLLIKQAWYRCLEHIRDPEKSVELINERYAPSKNEDNLQVKQSPSYWFERYDFFDAAIFNQPEVWREKQILMWFKNYGVPYFTDLDIWDIVWDQGRLIFD